jgi:ribonuclease I
MKEAFTILASARLLSFTCRKFTIHGLWPENMDGTWPEFCGHKPFSAKALQDLLPELRQEWPSVFQSSEHFWRHEWLKHGTCATAEFPTEHLFFNMVLQLHKKYDLQVWFALNLHQHMPFICYELLLGQIEH